MQTLLCQAFSSRSKSAAASGETATSCGADTGVGVTREKQAFGT
ncbi:MAG: hypothetical protein ABR534_09160 [Desulfotignum sp.]